MSRHAGPIVIAALLTVLPIHGRAGDGWMPSIGPSVASADTADDVVDAAVLLFNQSTQVDRRGTHNLLLKSIRHLKDPATRPLYAHLAEAEHPGLKIHGILGLAEVNDDGRVDLKRVAQIGDPLVQSTIITAAMDADLLDHEQAKQMLRWDGLANEVKVLIATRLVEAGEFSDTAILHDALTGAKKLGGSALAALLLVQLDDPAGLAHLSGVVDGSEDSQRDTVRGMLLQTALKHEFDRVGPWALSIAKDPQTDPVLALLAMRTALRFGEPGAVDLWQMRFAEASDSPAGQVRLALTALHLAPWMDAGLYEAIRQVDDPMLAAIGEAGSQIASGSQGAGDAAAALLEFGHPMINAWALTYASDHASDFDAQVILLGLVLAYEQSPPRGKARRLDEAVRAVEALYERSPEAAVTLLRPMLEDPATDKLIEQAILLGLIRSRESGAYDVVDGLESELNSLDAQGLALLLLARTDRPMDAEPMDELSMFARGGGRLEDSLRVQAAWLYLKRIGRADEALGRVLGNTNP